MSSPWKNVSGLRWSIFRFGMRHSKKGNNKPRDYQDLDKKRFSKIPKIELPCYALDDNILFDRGYVRLVDIVANRGKQGDMNKESFPRFKSNRGRMFFLEIDKTGFNIYNDENTLLGDGIFSSCPGFDMRYTEVLQSAFPLEEYGLTYEFAEGNRMLIISYTANPNEDITLLLEARASVCDAIISRMM